MSGTERYAYAPNNQRVWRGVFYGNLPNATQTVNEITFYAPGGAKLALYRLPLAGYSPSSSSYECFGGKMIRNAQGWVNQDRLGSIGKYFPYGQEQPSATPEGAEKFATYFRDENTGLDYAQNRYHKPGEGRFMSPDPYLASGGPADPGSWNRYAYTRGDPVNRYDPSGLLDACPTGDGCRSTFPSLANCTLEFWKAECGGSGRPSDAGGGDYDPCFLYPDLPMCSGGDNQMQLHGTDKITGPSLIRGGRGINEALKQSLEQMGGCAFALGQSITGGVNALFRYIDEMTFVDGRETIAYDHLYTIGAFATTVRAEGRATKTIVLWRNFFGATLVPNPRGSQVVTLISAGGKLDQ